MKVLHVIHSLDLRSGGPSHVIRQLIRQQVRVGHEVALVATDRQSGEPWDASEEYTRRMMADPALAGAEVFVGRAFGRRRPWLTYAFSPACRRWLKRKMQSRQTRPDVVHIHGTFSHLTNVAAKIARHYGIPYIVRLAGNLDAKCFHTGRRFLKRLFFRSLLLTDLRRAAAIHATSIAEAEELRELLPATRVEVVPLGTPLPADPATAGERFLEQFPELAGRRIVLYMSRIAPKKRLELLVESIASLRSAYPDIMLLVAGHDAGHLPVVEQAVARWGMHDHVKFTGFLEGDLKSGAFAAAELFALPSIDENFGVCVIEAMAHGLPVLLTPGVASHVYVDKSGAGETVEGTAELFADGIDRLLAAEPKVLGAKGREYVAEHLSWSKIASEVDLLYELAISSACPESIAE